jgi:energy-coupling factor transporter ATP-binding protein EcfA2
MLVLKRLKIKRYRNVVPGTELRFDDGVNLILGQNAAGKTTLLSLLSAVCRSAFKQIEDEEFELEYELQNERFMVIVEVAHRRVPVSEGEAALGVGATWNDDYQITIQDHDAPVPTTIKPSASQSVKLVMDWSFVGAALTHQREPLRQLRNALLQEHAFTFRFDESIECFLSITGRPPATPGPATPPVAMSSIRDYRSKIKGGLTITSGAFVPRDLSNALHKAFDYAKSPRELNMGAAGQELGQAMAAALGVRRVEIIPNVAVFSHTDEERSFAVNGFSFEIERTDGTFLHHDKLSYGQKRMIAFLYYLAGNSSTVIADELVNGLHHKWIDRCMEALKGRQAFLTSQNPLLFDYVEFGSPQMVQDGFITCKLEQIDGREQMVWENMSADDAKRFYDDYEVGIMHVGDILKVKGLW